jgi:hypothetical protein
LGSSGRLCNEELLQIAIFDAVTLRIFAISPKIGAEMVQAKYEKDKIRVRRKNGNGAKKKGLF